MNAVKVSAPSHVHPPFPTPHHLDPAPPSLHGVYLRTSAGHQEVLQERQLLAPAARRLLKMVTGLTPLNVLTPQTSGIDDPLGAATTLLDAGLIEPVLQDQLDDDVLSRQPAICS